MTLHLILYAAYRNRSKRLLQPFPFALATPDTLHPIPRLIKLWLIDLTTAVKGARCPSIGSLQLQSCKPVRCSRLVQMTTHQPEPSTQQLLTALLQSQAQGHHKLDLLTDQIGHLTEVVTTGFSEMKEGFSELKDSFSELKDGFSELKDGFSELRVLAQEQAKAAKDQAESISRLTASTGRQEENISRLAATVERQAQIVERLLPRESQSA